MKPTLLLIQENFIAKYIGTTQVAVYEVQSVDQDTMTEIFNTKEDQ